MATNRVVTGPAELPVSLSQLKSHLQDSSDDQDGYLADLLARACEDATGVCNIGLGLATYEYRSDRFPCWMTITGEPKPITLPVRPVTAIVAVNYHDEDDEEQEFEDFWLEGESGRLAAKEPWPATMSGRPGAVRIQYTAGHTVDTVPKKLVQAVLLIAANYYRHRGDGDSGVELPIPPAAARLLWQLYDGEM